MKSFLVQNETYSSHRFINFLDEKFFDTLNKYLSKQLHGQNPRHLSYLQLSVYKNNARSRVLLKYQKTEFHNFKTLFRQEISRLYLDLANDFYIDGETFRNIVLSEPLFASLLGTTGRIMAVVCWIY